MRDLVVQVLQYSIQLHFTTYDLILYEEVVDHVHQLCNGIEPGTDTSVKSVCSNNQTWANYIFTITINVKRFSSLQRL